jgi:hypothetical protein
MVCLSMRTAGRLQVPIVATTGLLLLVLVFEQVSGFAGVPWFVQASAADGVKANSLQCSASVAGTSSKPATDPTSVLVDDRLKKLQNVKNLRGEVSCAAVRSDQIDSRNWLHSFTNIDCCFRSSRAAYAHIAIGRYSDKVLIMSQWHAYHRDNTTDD